LTFPWNAVQCGHIKNHIGSGGIPITTEIGIRELKIRASEVVRAVMENRSRYVITLRGKPAALLIPIDADYDREKVSEVWNRLQDLRDEVGKGKQGQKNSLEIIKEMRR
jgi:prevent-host-death family protein